MENRLAGRFANQPGFCACAGQPGRLRSPVAGCAAFYLWRDGDDNKENCWHAGVRPAQEEDDMI